MHDGGVVGGGELGAAEGCAVGDAVGFGRGVSFGSGLGARFRKRWRLKACDRFSSKIFGAERVFVAATFAKHSTRETIDSFMLLGNESDFL